MTNCNCQDQGHKSKPWVQSRLEFHKESETYGRHHLFSIEKEYFAQADAPNSKHTQCRAGPNRQTRFLSLEAALIGFAYGNKNTRVGPALWD
ncbi:hypothetical protein CEXT_522021 [Caerostris extrusa]|uniref:Uncharacterized protein n=1 Tax=Caerostris extrusa TaxID=172846 RepID=A0AAV4PQ11_CAEEX|nr:hypothetical protein CEXT_522021 [Caerostris extrusa]